MPWQQGWHIKGLVMLQARVYNEINFEKKLNIFSLLHLPCLDNLMRQARGKPPQAEHVANQEE